MEPDFYYRQLHAEVHASNSVSANFKDRKKLPAHGKNLLWQNCTENVEKMKMQSILFSVVKSRCLYWYF